MMRDEVFDEQKKVAGVLIKQGARAVIVSHETGLTASLARRLYKHLKKEPSPSGLLPDSVEYFFTGQNREHSSAFWRCYKTAAERFGKKRGPEAPAALIRGQVLAAAYDHYSRICGGPEKALPIDRMWHLTRVIRAKDQVAESKCRICGATYIVRSYESGFICDSCESDVRGSRG